MAKKGKSDKQLENERITEEIRGTYSELVKREETKHKLLDAIIAKSAPKQTGVSPIVVLFLILVSAGIVVYAVKN